MNVGEWIIVHRLFEIDRIEHFYLVARILKHPARLDQDCAFWICDAI